MNLVQLHFVELRLERTLAVVGRDGRSSRKAWGRLSGPIFSTWVPNWREINQPLLYKVAGQEWNGRAVEETFAEFDSGSALLERHTVATLGEEPDGRNVRIMVTMPSEAAHDPNLVRDFLDRGMNIMRINCAHDSAQEWLRMVENLHAAQKETGKPCKIAFDLAGPKLRTGPVSPSPGIIRWKPVRNDLGQVTSAAFITFYTESYSSEDETIPIPIKGAIFRQVQAGTSLNSSTRAGVTAPFM
jgi:pyruvate kinase